MHSMWWIWIIYRCCLYLLGFDKIPNIPPKIRFDLNNKLKIKGLEKICLELKKIDAISYKNIDLNNLEE